MFVLHIYNIYVLYIKTSSLQSLICLL